MQNLKDTEVIVLSKDEVRALVDELRNCWKSAKDRVAWVNENSEIMDLYNLLWCAIKREDVEEKP
jgi:hypothetical protein